MYNMYVMNFPLAFFVFTPSQSLSQILVPRLFCHMVSRLWKCPKLHGALICNTQKQSELHVAAVDKHAQDSHLH